MRRGGDWPSALSRSETLVLHRWPSGCQSCASAVDKTASIIHSIKDTIPDTIPHSPRAPQPRSIPTSKLQRHAHPCHNRILQEPNYHSGHPNIKSAAKKYESGMQCDPTIGEPAGAKLNGSASNAAMMLTRRRAGGWGAWILQVCLDKNLVLQWAISSGENCSPSASFG